MASVSQTPSTGTASVMLTRLLAAAPLVIVSAAALASAWASGQLDPTFGGGGWVRSFNETGYTRGYMPHGAEDVALQPDGKILATGEILDGGSDYYFGAYRWTENGQLDKSFGDSGWAVTRVGDVVFPHAVSVQRDGKVLVAGEADCSSIWCLILVRYTAGGQLDRTFGRAGVVRVGGRHCPCYAFDVEVLPSGRILAVGKGYVRGFDGTVIMAARFLASGALDRTFGHRGWAWVLFPGPGIATASAVGRDGRIVLVGAASGTWSTRSSIAVARLLPNGRRDRSFSGDGRRLVTFWSDRASSAWDVGVQPDGRIVVVGTSSIGLPITHVRLAVVRLKRNGALDRRFAGRGRTLLKPAPYGGSGSAIGVQRDGGVVVAGTGYDSDDFDSSSWILARYLANGRLDRSFGHRGIAVGDFGSGMDWAGALAIQPDGRIVVGGEVYGDQAIARYR